MTVAMFAVASAQERTVTGQVIYAGDGEPLVGASVLPIGGGVGCAPPTSTVILHLKSVLM